MILHESACGIPPSEHMGQPKTRHTAQDQFGINDPIGAKTRGGGLRFAKLQLDKAHVTG